MNKLQCIPLSSDKQEKFDLLEIASYMRDKGELDPFEHEFLVLQVRQEYERKVEETLKQAYT